MRTRMILALTVAVVVVVMVVLFGWPVAAQNRVQIPSVMAERGIHVQEVRVGESCVVVVTSTRGTGTDLAAVPCGSR